MFTNENCTDIEVNFLVMRKQALSNILQKKASSTKWSTIKLTSLKPIRLF